MKPFIRTLWWENGSLYIIDQQKLPSREISLKLTSVRDVVNAIKALKVRGAPAIGCAAAFGVAISALKSRTSDPCKLRDAVLKDIKMIASSRPTAYNLFYSLGRMSNALEEALPGGTEKIREKLLSEALDIFREDLDCCRRIGVNGASLIRNGMNILTHCNAGALATSGFGTALAPLFAAKKKGLRFHVYVDETRPVLQGARLTAWELGKAGIAHTLICDNMSGSLMKQGKVDMVITGADRIAANGDTANKIGTYPLAVLAHYHGIPFYVAAPYSTFDPAIESGKDIVIEERDPEEVRKCSGKMVSPAGTRVYNPAFDITPAKLIRSFITENGIIKKA